MSFFGREQELLCLNDLWKKRVSSLVVVTGRRRIGKSTLIEKFGETGKFFEFVGLPPTPGITAESQREAFAKQLIKYFGSAPSEHNWWQLLWFLAEKIGEQKTVLLFDEISWMSIDDPEFLGVVKTLWDTEFKKKKQLVFILCGSISSWIEKNILSSTGFLGRTSLTLRLEELPLSTCDLFWHQKRSHISAYEKCMILSITGGIPRYLEEIRPDVPAEENIRKMCFDPGGFLFLEFDRIFADLFNKRSALYKQIVLSLATGPKERKEIAAFVDLKLGGVLSDYLEDLIQAGFITKHPTWSLSNTKQSNLIMFRLSDNYIRFYLKYITPNKNLIELKTFTYRSLSTLPGFSAMMGLQFENLVFHNRPALHKALGIPREDIIMEGPFFQRKTKSQPGCQIDYLIQMRFGAIYVCEIKFSKEKISLDVIAQVKSKISACKRPKFLSWRPVLIHVNGVTSDVEEEGYFAHIISFADLFR